MPICPGCGKTVAEEGINCRECIIKTREKAASEPDDFDALFDSLEKKIPKAEHDQDEIDAMTHLVEDTLMGNLRKSILKNSSSGVDYQEAIAEDSLEKLFRLGDDATDTVQGLLGELDPSHPFQAKLLSRIRDSQPLASPDVGHTQVLS